MTATPGPSRRGGPTLAEAPPQPATRRQRRSWRERAAHYLETRRPRSEAWTLDQGSIYILPTRAGWAFAATLAAMLLAAINYQLNLGYGLIFLLSGAGLVAMHQTHGNLRGLTLRVRAPLPVHAGDAATLEILVDNPGPARIGVGLGVYRAGAQAMAWVDVPEQGQCAARLSFPASARGVHLLPTVMAETHFPLALFRAWTVWRPAGQVLVYPRPERPAQALPPAQAAAAGGAATQAAGGSEFDGVRAWRRGDTLRQVVWKKAARTGELVSRDAVHSTHHELWLDYAGSALPETEARLSRLAAWVLLAEQQGASFGLRLPGLELPPAGGESQRRMALEALARWQAPNPPAPAFDSRRR